MEEEIAMETVLRPGFATRNNADEIDSNVCQAYCNIHIIVVNTFKSEILDDVYNS